VSCSELVAKHPPCGLSKSPDHFSSLLSYTEEIVAHASNVSSLVLGKASGRLLATGGDDCRVNLWSINKPNCIMVSDDVPRPWGERLCTPAVLPQLLITHHVQGYRLLSQAGGKTSNFRPF
jgi:WD40 repeat protein